MASSEEIKETQRQIEQFGHSAEALNRRLSDYGTPAPVRESLRKLGDNQHMSNVGQHIKEANREGG